MSVENHAENTGAVRFLASVEKNGCFAPAHEPDWLRGTSESAREQFLRTGFPTLRDEDWKYTDVRPIAEASYVLASSGPAESAAVREAARPFMWPAAEAYRLVFVDGFFSETLSSAPHRDKNVVLGSLRRHLDTPHPAVREHLTRHAHHSGRAFDALNTAFISDGYFLFVPKNTTLDKPVHVLFVFSPGADKRMAQIRNLLVAEACSRVTVIESIVSLGQNDFFVNAVTETAVGPSATVDHYALAREDNNNRYKSSSYITQARDSRFTSLSTTLGQTFYRKDVFVTLSGEGAESDINGLYLTHRNQHVDHLTVLRHQKPNGTSRQLFKGILDGRSRSVFSGKVFVAEDAQKTNADQTNKNLLLSEHASADTRPQLEIFADDVKCTHGATVGQLDPESLFYLKSRGIGQETAERILTYGFMYELIEKIPVKRLHDEIDRLIRERYDAPGNEGGVHGR